MWQKQKDDFGWLHFYDIDDECAFHVYKTAGGDYAMTCYRDGDPCGGDPEYFNTLKEAKNTVERIIQSGNWERYTLDLESPLLTRPC